MSADLSDDPPFAAMAAVSVRTLAAFAARTGSIHHRFTPAPTALQGTEGHQQVYRKRPRGYRTEVALSTGVDGLLVRGRADGFCERDQRLEEIKTFYGDVDSIPANQQYLHWAQLKLYGWLYCRQEKAEAISLALIYFQLEEEQEHRFDLELSAEDLERECLAMVAKYQTWHRALQKRRLQLTKELTALRFPYPEFHRAQRDMAEAVYKSAATRRTLLIEAPTGTGKTLAALFPALKAMGQGHLDKLLYLTCKNTGKQPALDAVRQLGADGSRLRVLELSAQANCCLAPDKRCDGDSCPYARGFYDKLETARAAASRCSLLDKAALEALALEFEICPYYLAIEMSRWTDLIVADVNQFFDGSPLLARLSQEMGWRAHLLVDESHNLVERGRMMFSATLDRALLLQAKQVAPAPLKKILNRLNRHWRALESAHGGTGYTCLAEVPAGFLRSVQAFTEAFHSPQALHLYTPQALHLDPQQTLHLDPQQTLHIDPPPVPGLSADGGDLREFYFQALRFQTVREESSTEDYSIELETDFTGRSSLTLKNQIPARLLARRLAHAQAGCFFSATLQPADYYRTMLGLPEETVIYQADSPFLAAQLQVKIFRQLSTRYRDRHASSPALARTIVDQIERRPGNALVFVSSYAYLETLAVALKDILGDRDVELVLQGRQMSEVERAQFVEAFRAQKNLLGVAVLGGIFGEGVDLPGEALTGVFIASLGLPPTNAANEQLQRVLQARFGDGYRFTYLYPGVQKVVQAAGRVIRRQADRGYVYLLDDRFARAEVRRLLPAWWQVE